jgi:hypothetical protein
MENKNSIVIFLDQVGRTVLGEVVSQDTTKEVLAVRNPAVVAVSQQQTGQLSLQILPLFFKEFLADKNEPTVWLYQKDKITTCKDVLLDFKLNAQYQQLFAPVPLQPQQQSGTVQPDVVKLFDD